VTHAPAGPAWLGWLEATALATAMRQSAWLYPAVEIAHIVGFVVLVGSAFMFDLRRVVTKLDQLPDHFVDQLATEPQERIGIRRREDVVKIDVFLTLPNDVLSAM